MPTPPYRRISDDLRQQILSGRLSPGDRVPSENELAETHGVAKETARTALGVLAAEGLTEARRGSGTRVRDFRPIVRRGTKRVAESAWGDGRSVWDLDLDGRPLTVDQLALKVQPASERIARALAIDPGAGTWVRDRRYLVDGQPVMLATSHLPAAIVDGSPITAPDTGPGGIYARLADLGFAPEYFREVARARPALPDEVEALALAKGAVVMLIVRYAYAAGGVPVEVNEMTLDASRYLCEWEFPA